MGYRWYDFHEVEPAFPFGHGISYTSFEFKNLTIDQKDRTITVDITNTGNYNGKEVV
jgi:beta-glucosidase